MMISTKGRYALRVLVDMAEHPSDGYIPLKDIARRQEISEKYLKSIVRTLVQAQILEGLRGKGGGYRLKKPPEQYIAAEILRVTEGPLAPVACLEPGAEACPRAARCQFGCDTYGRSHCCPPRTPSWRETQAMLDC